MNGKTVKNKLRIGLLLDSPCVPNWAYVMLKRLQDSDYAEIRLIVFTGIPEHKSDVLPDSIRYPSRFLYAFYAWMEARLSKPAPDAFEPKDLKSLLAGIPEIMLEPVRAECHGTAEDKESDGIRKERIDVVVNLACAPVKGGMLKAAKYGVWSYGRVENLVGREGPIGFWEVFENDPITGSELRVAAEDPGIPMVLCRGYSATHPFSVKRNRNMHFWKTLSFVPRKLKQLYDLGEDEFFARVRAENRDAAATGGGLCKDPGRIGESLIFIRFMARYIKDRLCKLLYVDQWSLMFEFSKEPSYSFRDFKRILSPKDRFWADPFVIYKDDRYHIFIEEFLYKSNKCHISLITMDEKLGHGDPVRVLERPYNLSHPFVFEWKGDHYMIPESARNRTVEVYKCARFPDKWEFHKDLMKDINAVDATLYFHGGRWWLFANVVENDGAYSCDELFLYHADEPLSDSWRAHPQNPVVSDVRSSRPAGKIFEREGKIFRPSQDCSKSYGYGIKINQIITLNESEYEEIEVSSVYPDICSGISGFHTFNREHELTVIDGKLRRPKIFS